MSKVCTKCGAEKDESEFYAKKCVCKTCVKAVAKMRYEADPQVVKDRVKRYRDCNHEVVVERKRQWRKVNKDKEDARKRKWVESNREHVKAYRKERAERVPEVKERKRAYVQNNRDKVRKYFREYVRSRRDSDALFQLAGRVRALVRTYINKAGFRKSDKTEKILGCAFQDLMAHLGEKPTQDAEIDHIVPCAQAQNEEELLKLQHYTNLRWLSAEENLAKLDKKTPEGEEMCRKLLGREWID